MLHRRADRQPELSVVVPVLNESENIRPLLQRLMPVLDVNARSFEIIFVDDGSTDERSRFCGRCTWPITASPRSCSAAISARRSQSRPGLDHAARARSNHHGRGPAASARDDR